MAKCVAPGHDDCSVTCENGCYAIFYEPDGPCATGCSGSAVQLDESAQFSIQMSELPIADVAKLFGYEELEPLGFKADSRVTFSGTGLTKAALATRLQQFRSE